MTSETKPHYRLHYMNGGAVWELQRVHEVFRPYAVAWGPTARDACQRIFLPMQRDMSLNKQRLDRGERSGTSTWPPPQNGGEHS